MLNHQGCKSQGTSEANKTLLTFHDTALVYRDPCKWLSIIPNLTASTFQFGCQLNPITDD